MDWLQVEVAAWHLIPVSEVHSLSNPQTQVGEEVCGSEPSRGLQAGAVPIHTQAREPKKLDPHSRKEPVLTFTMDPPLFEMQPRA